MLDFLKNMRYNRCSIARERRNAMFRIGVCSVSFRQLPFEEVVKITAAAGLEAIEWGSDVHAPADDRERLFAIAKAQREAGLYCSSYGTYFRVGEHSPEELSSYIDAAEILGTKMLRIWCGKKNYEDMTEEEREYIREECRKCAEIAERRSVTLSIECHPNSFTNSAEGALNLMSSVGSPSLRMYWQQNTSVGDEGNFDYAEKLSAYTTNIHVFYYENKQKLLLKDGISKWKQYLSYFNGERTLLLEFMPDNSPQALKGEAEALKIIARN